MAEKKDLLASSRYIFDSDFSKIESVLDNSRDSLIVSLFYELGITVSELVNLKVSCINFELKQLFIENRVLPFSIELLDKLKKYFDDFSPQFFLFYTRQSSQITSRRVEQLLKQISTKIGCELTPSFLRKNYIVSQIRSGKDINSIKYYSGLKTLRKKEFLNNSEFNQFYSVVLDNKDKILIKLFYELGLNPFQVSSIKISDIDFKNNSILITNDSRIYGVSKLKTNSNLVKVSHSLSLLIKSYLETQIQRHNLSQNSYLFKTRQSEKISIRRIEQILSNYSQLSGLQIDVTPNVLKNSYLSNSIKNTDDFRLKTVRLYEYGHLCFAPTVSSDVSFGNEVFSKPKT